MEHSAAKERMDAPPGTHLQRTVTGKGLGGKVMHASGLVMQMLRTGESTKVEDIIV